MKGTGLAGQSQSPRGTEGRLKGEWSPGLRAARLASDSRGGVGLQASLKDGAGCLLCMR